MTETTNPFKVREVTNPDYKAEGTWYVDDGLQVVFFWDQGDAELYANDVWEHDRKQESA